MHVKDFGIFNRGLYSILPYLLMSMNESGHIDRFQNHWCTA